MKRCLKILIPAVFVLGVVHNAAGEDPRASKAQTMTQEDQTKLAMSAAPAQISDAAGIMVFGPDGKLKEIKKGTNGFTCIPDLDQQERPDPVCADQAAMQWVQDAMGKKEKPSNTVPGVAYMGQGGWHWEKDGKVIMNKDEPGAKRVKEPPHWMIMWPFEPAKTGLPTTPGDFGTYIMFEGSPYAHLMIYQDPAKLKK